MKGDKGCRDATMFESAWRLAARRGAVEDLGGAEYRRVKRAYRNAVRRGRRPKTLDGLLNWIILRAACNNADRNGGAT